MEIKQIQSTTFSSLKRPIPTETFISEMGKITMREALPDDIIGIAKLIRKREAQSYKLQHCTGSREKTKDAWALYNSINKSKWLKDITEHLKAMLRKPDGKTSILAAVDEDDKIIGMATMQSVDGINSQVGVIENLYLEYKYQKGNLGHYLLYKITDSARGQFNDVVTVMPSIGESYIYNDLGYRPMLHNSQDVKFLDQHYHPLGNACWGRKKCLK